MTAFKSAAEVLGWRWSSAHDGYISEGHRNRPGEDRNSWGSYEVAADAEEACFWDGVETEAAAAKFVSSDRKAFANSN